MLKTFLPLALLLIFVTACSDILLEDAAVNNFSVGKTEINFCTTRSDTIRSNLKFIIVMDRSGSNQQRYDINNNNAPLPGTDPMGTRRFDALIRFIQAFQSDPYIYWSFINFGSSASIARNFTNDRENFLTFVTDQRDRTAQIDGGSTNYLSAMDRVTDLITDDITAARNQDPIVSSNYVVFFISDGAPIVNGQMQDPQAILNNVDNLNLIQQNDRMVVEGIQVNSAYYYEPPIEPAAQDLLSDMSITGNGDFLEFGSGQEIDFNRFSVPTRVSRFSLKEIWMVNANSVWEGDRLIGDTDADGISDVLERTVGSLDNNGDTDGNGVGDGVEYKLTGNTRPCRDAQCRSSNAEPYTTCRSLQVSTNPVRYNDRDNDYLNDCEEKLLGSDMNDPDTNDDYIPDRIAFQNNIQMTNNSNANNLDPDQDGRTDYQELKQNTPVRTHNGLVDHLRSLRYTGRLVSSTLEQDCYQFEVFDLIFHAQSDQMRVYIMENTQILNERRMVRVAQKPAAFGAVWFYNEDFN